jgi:predicted transcriptional regulator
MESPLVTIQIPADLHSELQSLAEEEHTSPAEVIERLLAMSRQRRAWLRDLAALREQIQRDGGLQIGKTKEAVVEQMRETRRQIFETEYAHLYR